MKVRVGACALLVCLAGCTAQEPNARFGDKRGAVSTDTRTARALPSVATQRKAAVSVADAPDRGELFNYKNKATPAKQEGAYTWYPVAISEAHALRSVVDGVLSVPSPDGSDVKVRYERHIEHADGNWTWIGRVVGGDQKQEAILTFGEKAVYGSIPQKSGAPLSLQTRNGVLFAVQTDLSKVKNPNSRTDMMVKPALALRSALLQSAPKAQVTQSAIETKAAATRTIDVALGYTAGFATAQGSQSAAVTRLAFLIDVGNQAFRNSLIDGELRVVNAVQVAYTDTTTNKSALGELTGHNGTTTVPIPASLTPLRTARDQYGADLAVLVRKFQTPENDGCGIAWLNGSGQVAIDPNTDDDYGYAVISDGNDTGTDGNSYFCAPETMVHEMGHLMGSAHDRDNSKKDDGSLLYGRYPYSFGMKTTAANGNFYTIMAYGDNNQNFYRTFSNPLVLKCGPTQNLACGVANETDNARSLNQTIPIVATFRARVVPLAIKPRNDMNNDGRSDVLWHNTGINQHGYWLMNGATVSGSKFFAASSGYRMAVSGDFNGDGYGDEVWTNTARNFVMLLGSASGNFSDVGLGVGGVGWNPVGSGDVNADGRDDILWHNATTNQHGYWLMNGGAIVGQNFFSAAAGFTVATSGDFNGDGYLDEIWINAGRQMYLLLGNGSSFASFNLGIGGVGWKAVGSGDVNGDGRSDVLWHNSTTNQHGYWLMGPTGGVADSRFFSASPNYRIATVGNFNGDGLLDEIWTSDARDLWLLSGSASGNFNSLSLGVGGAGWVAMNPTP